MTHSDVQPHAPEHPYHGEAYPSTPEYYIGTVANHTSWKNRLHRHRYDPQQLEEEMNKHQCKNTLNIQKSVMALLEPPSGPTRIRHELPIATETQEKDHEYNFIKVMEI